MDNIVLFISLYLRHIGRMNTWFKKLKKRNHSHRGCHITSRVYVDKPTRVQYGKIIYIYYNN